MKINKILKNTAMIMIKFIICNKNYTKVEHLLKKIKENEIIE